MYKVLPQIMSLEEPTTWADVAGLAGPKKILKEIVVWPFLRPDIFKVSLTHSNFHNPIYKVSVILFLKTIQFRIIDIIA